MTGGGSLTDLLAAAQRGDERAFGALWSELNPALVRYLTVVAGARAGQLAGETWIELAGGLRRFRGDEASWRTLVFGTARRRARRAARKLATGPAPAPAPAAFEGALADAVTRVALELVAALPAPQGEVIVLRTAGRLDVADVARVLKLSEPTVRAAAHAGLARAGALAAEQEYRDRISRGEPVEDPPGWDRTGFVAGLGEVETAFEDLLAGRATRPGAPDRVRLVESILTALRAPASVAELRGSGVALAAFGRAFAAHPRRAGGGWPVSLRLGTRASAAAAVLVLAVSGTALAAYTGVLPRPLQDTAHDWFDAPSYSGGQPDGSGGPTGSHGSGGSGAAGRPGGSAGGSPPASASVSAHRLTSPSPTPSATPSASSHVAPGATHVPPGSTRTPPGRTRTPPQPTRTPRAPTKSPSHGSTRTPPGSTHSATHSSRPSQTPPGSTKTPSGSTKTPSGSTKTPSGSTRTSPGASHTSHAHGRGAE